jgi:hypothetical protein
MNHRIHLCSRHNFLWREERVSMVVLHGLPFIGMNQSTRLYSIDNGTPANGAEQRLFWGGGSTGTYDVTVSTQYLGWLLLSEEE